MRSLLFLLSVIKNHIYYKKGKRMEAEFMDVEVNNIINTVLADAKSGAEIVAAAIAVVFVILIVMMIVKNAKETKTKDIEVKKVNVDKYNKHKEYGFKYNVR